MRKILDFLIMFINEVHLDAYVEITFDDEKDPKWIHIRKVLDK